METKKIRYLIFLKDVLVLSITSFGGPQAHLALFLEKLVNKHRYLTEAELLEMQSLCQILPGPTSTQVITAIGEFAKPLDVGGVHCTELLPPAVDGLFGDLVLARHLGHGGSVGLAQDRDHLLFGESTLSHGLLAGEFEPFSQVMK